MSKTKFPFIFGLSLLLCCNRASDCGSVKNGQYVGYAIVFYHKPDSGNMVEISIVPVCGDTLNLKGDIESGIKELKIFEGVSYNIGIRDSSFMKVFEKSQKINLLNNQTLASELRVVYACPVYVEFKDAENITESTTGSKQNSIHEKLVFKDGQQVTLKYFLSNTLRVLNLRVL
jgi:hypothetical protein